jgi:SAM-dependent methyltransferase
MKKIIRWLVRYIPRPLLIRFSYVFSFVFRLFYAGNRYECPVCGGKFRKLLPYGYGKKTSENRLCPKCLSLERHRLLWIFFRDTGFFTSPMKMLHIAPEQCFLKRFKKIGTIDYTTGDLESPIADIHFDIRNIPLENDLYDFVMCNHVLEHIDDEQKAMKEILRILKPGGKAILQVPLDYSRSETFEDNSVTGRKEREEIFGQYDHLRVYGTDYGKRLVQAGFSVEVNRFIESLDPMLRERYRLPETEWIYLCVKP